MFQVLFAGACTGAGGGDGGGGGGAAAADCTFESALS
mgnify:CR=1 FL=1